MSKFILGQILCQMLNILCVNVGINVTNILEMLKKKIGTLYMQFYKWNKYACMSTFW